MPGAIVGFLCTALRAVQAICSPPGEPLWQFLCCHNASSGLISLHDLLLRFTPFICLFAYFILNFILFFPHQVWATGNEFTAVINLLSTVRRVSWRTFALWQTHTIRPQRPARTGEKMVFTVGNSTRSLLNRAYSPLNTIQREILTSSVSYAPHGTRKTYELHG